MILTWLPLLLVLVSGCQTKIMKVPIASWSTTHYTAPDGTNFPYSRWLPKESPHAVILAIHGLGGAASDWRPLGEYFQKRGVAVYAHELRGMGNDPVKARVGDLDRHDGWLEDFTSFALRVQSTHPDIPIFWYGESLGGIIGTHLLDKADGFGLRSSGFILASPIVQISGKLPFWQAWGLRLGAHLMPRHRLNILSLADDRKPPAQVVSTTSHEEQLGQTPHAVERFSLRLLNGIRTLVAANREIIRKNKWPILVLYAGHDIFTDPSEVEAFYEEIGGDQKDKRYFPGGFHLLLHDLESAKILQEIENWLVKVQKNSE